MCTAKLNTDVKCYGVNVIAGVMVDGSGVIAGIIVEVSGAAVSMVIGRLSRVSFMVGGAIGDVADGMISVNVGTEIEVGVISPPFDDPIK